MPMKVNIGLSKKLGESNYGSRGASVNLELELDGSLVQEHAKLQEKIRQLFGLVRTSLAEELNGGAGHAQNGNGTNQQPSNGSGQQPTNGNSQSSSKPRPATQSQVKALHAIAKNQGLDLTRFIREQFQARKPEELSIKEASQAIDRLKSSNQ